MTRQNAEAFARLINQALSPAQEETPAEDQNTGPRKPSPVPEVGQATGPLDRATILRAQFNDALHSMNHRL